MGGSAGARSAWPLLVAVPVTAVASIVAVVMATASAGIAKPGGASGAVALVAGEPGDARLDVPAMLPGRSVRTCREVTVAGSTTETDELRVYGASSGPLVAHLAISIRRGAPGGSCTTPGELVAVFDGPLADLGSNFATGHDGAANPGVDRPATAGRTVPYVVVVRLDASTPNGAQGAPAVVDLTWEVRRGPAPH